MAAEVYAYVENTYALQPSVPSRADLQVAAENLMFLSNHMSVPYGSGHPETYDYEMVDKAKNEIKTSLKFFGYGKKP